MCGIVGSFSFKDSPFQVTESLIVKMRDEMAHRGPDGKGIWLSNDGKIGLGHRRLAIIDLSEAASQPMSNEDGTLWVVFNGEIYNHSAIRTELEETGNHIWKTDHSDTEVILHAFEEWGIDSIHRFRGMFAFALWDAKTRELWLVRDRIGIKPLYYSFHHGRINFASEIKALIRDPDQERKVHETALYHYLSFLIPPAPQTLFYGIMKLPPGTWMRINENGDIKQERYWDVWDFAEPLVEVPEDEIIKRLMCELRTSVSLRKVSDVPVGVFLSGGIDSSTNAALFSEGETSNVKTFTIGYQGEYSSYRNEVHYARKMADLVHAEHHELLLSQDDLIDFLPSMVRLQDEPIADPVCVPVYYVSKLARDNGVIVCQVGEGADELFCGYPLWMSLLKLEKLNRNPFSKLISKLGMGFMQVCGLERSFKYEVLRRSKAGLPLFWGGAEAFTETFKKRLLSPRLRKQFKGYTSWEAIKPIRERFEQKAWEQSDLNWMTYLDLNHRLPELLLMRVDKMSMGVSLEGRVPFLDHKFVELVMSIPTKMKIDGNVTKPLLKKATRGLIPDELIDRPKQGFGVPVYEWFYDRLGDMIRKELTDVCNETDYFDKAEIDYVLSSGKGPHAWFLMNFALWWKEYIA